MNDEATCQREEPSDERESIGTYLPRRRDDAVNHTVRDQPPTHARFAVHGIDIAPAVSPAKRHPGDEMMEDEVVEHDEARCPAKRFDDPAV